MEPKLTHLLCYCLLLFLPLISKSAIAKPSSSPNPRNSMISFVVSSCHITRYPNLCIKCLSTFATKIHHNENRLAQTALAVTLVRVRSTTVYVAKLMTKARRIKRRREYLAVKDCVENLGDGLEMLVQSMREMKHVGRDRDEFLWRLSNVETWVSAALTDETTCLDGFDGKVMDGMVKSAIRRRVVHVARVTSNALALVNRFASRHKS